MIARQLKNKPFFKKKKKKKKKKKHTLRECARFCLRSKKSTS